METIITTATVNNGGDASQGKTQIELRRVVHQHEGIRYRWYISKSGADTEVSHTNLADALDEARLAWRVPGWGLKIRPIASVVAERLDSEIANGCESDDLFDRVCRVECGAIAEHVGDRVRYKFVDGSAILCADSGAWEVEHERL